MTAPFAAGRIHTLDVIRGVAILGIIVMNVLFFTMPTPAYFNPRSYGGLGLADQLVWAFSFVWVEDKMRNLFAMLFGAGVVLMLGKAPGQDRAGLDRAGLDRAGLDRAGLERVGQGLARHYWRMAWLLAIGMAHAILLANNDILRVYAVAGLVLPLFAGLSIRALVMLAILAMAVHMLVGGYIGVQWLLAYWDSTAPGWAQRMAPAELTFGADAARIAAQLAEMQGPYADVIARRMDNISGNITYVVSALPTALSAMLAGMVLMKTGFFGGSWMPRRYGWMMLWALLLGFMPSAVLAYWAWSSGYHAVPVATNALIWSAPFDLVAALGWAAAIVTGARAFPDGFWARRLAACGQWALTNYLMTSLVLSFVFFGFGLGLFGSVSRLGALGVAGMMMVAIIGWSYPLQRRWGRGPAERFWRWLTACGLALLPHKRG